MSKRSSSFFNQTSSSSAKIRNKYVDKEPKHEPFRFSLSVERAPLRRENYVVATPRIIPNIIYPVYHVDFNNNEENVLLPTQNIQLDETREEIFVLRRSSRPRQRTRMIKSYKVSIFNPLMAVY